MLKTIGLTTLPKNRLKANQALLRGAKADGIKMVIRAKSIESERQAIANHRKFLSRKYKYPTKNIRVNKHPNFLLEVAVGGGGYI